MRVLLDTDVIFDFLLEREPFFQAAHGLILLITKMQFSIPALPPVGWTQSSHAI